MLINEGTTLTDSSKTPDPTKNIDTENTSNGLDGINSAGSQQSNKNLVVFSNSSDDMELGEQTPTDQAPVLNERSNKSGNKEDAIIPHEPSLAQPAEVGTERGLETGNTTPPARAPPPNKNSDVLAKDNHGIINPSPPPALVEDI
jgi:hypothetical protein